MNMKVRLTGRAALRLSAATIASVILAGAAIAPAAFAKTMDSNHVVNILFWSGHPSGKLHAAVLHEVAEFNATHKDIHVQYKLEYASEKGIAAYLAHKAPNVAMLGTYAIEPFIKAGAAVDLRSFINGPHGFTKAEIAQDYYAPVWKDMQAANGAQYILPLEKKSAVVVYYNEDLFKRAHIAHAPATWAQLESDAYAISKLGGKIHGMAWTPSVRQFFAMTMDFGGEVWTDPSQKYFNLNNPGAIKAFTMLRKMVADKVLIPTSGYNYQLDFGTGNIGMLVDASAGYTYDYGSVGGKFPMLAAPAPAGPTGRAYNYLNGQSLMMFKTGTPAQQQAAWTFMKWMSSPQNNTYWNEHTNYLPLGPKGYDLIKGFYKKNTAYAASFSDPKYWIIKPPYYRYSEAKSAMDSDFLKGLLGQVSIRQALIDMTTAGNKFMAGQERL
jgi:ABC-type glycerol-3-phosphate transport system substrate-binding protein